MRQCLQHDSSASPLPQPLLTWVSIHTNHTSVDSLLTFLLTDYFNVASLSLSVICIFVHYNQPDFIYLAAFGLDKITIDIQVCLLSVHSILICCKFLQHAAMPSTVLATAICLSVCLSVRHTSVLCPNEHRMMLSSQLGSRLTLAFVNIRFISIFARDQP